MKLPLITRSHAKKKKAFISFIPKNKKRSANTKSDSGGLRSESLSNLEGRRHHSLFKCNICIIYVCTDTGN